MGRLILAAVVLGGSADSGLAQAPEPVTPDLARLSDGKSAQVFNRALAVATEGGRTVVRLDARAGEGGVLLQTERPGQFEQAIDPPPDPNGWFHARIVLAGGRVEVYVNGAGKPSLAVEDLGTAKSGGVALFVGNGSDGAFADLRVTATAPAGPPPPS